MKRTAALAAVLMATMATALVLVSPHPARAQVAGQYIGVVSDAFNRANTGIGGGLGSTPTGGKPWTTPVGTWGIVSNTAYVQTQNLANSDPEIAYVDVAEGDGAVQLDVPAIGAAADSSGLLIRYADAANFVAFRKVTGNFEACPVNTWALYSVDATVYTPFICSGITAAAGAVLRVEMTGTAYTVFVNGIQRGGPTTRAGHTGTNRHGIYGLTTGAGASGTARFDNFVFYRWAPTPDSCRWEYGGAVESSPQLCVDPNDPGQTVTVQPSATETEIAEQTDAMRAEQLLVGVLVVFMLAAGIVLKTWAIVR